MGSWFIQCCQERFQQLPLQYSALLTFRQFRVNVAEYNLHNATQRWPAVFP